MVDAGDHQELDEREGVGGGMAVRSSIETVFTSPNPFRALNAMPLVQRDHQPMAAFSG